MRVLVAVDDSAFSESVIDAVGIGRIPRYRCYTCCSELSPCLRLRSRKITLPSWKTRSSQLAHWSSGLRANCAKRYLRYKPKSRLEKYLRPFSTKQLNGVPIS